MEIFQMLLVFRPYHCLKKHMIKLWIHRTRLKEELRGAQNVNSAFPDSLNERGTAALRYNSIESVKELEDLHSSSSAHPPLQKEQEIH